MIPIDFPEKTNVLQKPAGMTDEECAPLPIWTDREQCISCWRPTWRERFSILIFGKIWLSVFSGPTQPPVWLQGKHTVFIKQAQK